MRAVRQNILCVHLPKGSIWTANMEVGPKKPYHICFVGSNSILACNWTPGLVSKKTGQTKVMLSYSQGLRQWGLPPASQWLLKSRSKPRPPGVSKSRSPGSGLYYSYGVDYRTLRWIYFFDPLSSLGSTSVNHKLLSESDLNNSSWHLFSIGTAVQRISPVQVPFIEASL